MDFLVCINGNIYNTCMNMFCTFYEVNIETTQECMQRCMYVLVCMYRCVNMYDVRQCSEFYSRC